MKCNNKKIRARKHPALNNARIMADVEDEKARLRQQIEELRALKQVMAASAGGPATLGTLVLDVLSELVDDEIASVAFEFHRAMRLGLFCPCTPASPAHTCVDLARVPALVLNGRVRADTEG